MKSKVRYAIIVCTKSRLADLKRLLESISKQTIMPEQIYIVDASGTSPSHVMVDDFKRTHNIPILYRHSTKGLPKQRNIGIELAEGAGDVLSFLDDDVELEPEYYGHIVKVFSEDLKHEIAGICGNSRNEKPRPFMDRFIRNLFFIADNKRNGILPSGDAGHIFSPREDTDVSVLSGCNMNFRAELFYQELLRFDEYLSDYAYMEDQDFSVRASRYGKLRQIIKAGLLHHVSRVSRISEKRRFEMYVINSYYLLRKNLSPHAFNFICYAWRLVGKLFHSIITSAALLSISPVQGFLTGCMNYDWLYKKVYIQIVEMPLKSSGQKKP